MVWDNFTEFSVQSHFNLVLKMYLKVGNVQLIISSQKQTIDNSFNDIRTYQ